MADPCLPCIVSGEGSARHLIRQMIRRHTSYILAQLAITTTTIAVALVSVIWLTQSLRFLDFIINRGLSALSFLKVTLLLLPSILTAIIPVAVLCAVIYTFNRLTIDRELVVMRSAGIAKAMVERAMVFGKAKGWNRLEVTAPARPRWDRTKNFYLANDFVEGGPRLQRYIL